MSTPQLLPIEKNSKEILQEVKKNLLKMLKERKLIDEPNDDLNNEQTTFIIPTKKGNYHVKIYRSHITSLNKIPEIIDFLNATSDHKILIVQLISNKTEQIMRINYPDTEIFLEKTLMMNLIDFIMIPKHELLSSEETQNVLEEYRIKKNELPKILLNDPVAKYYDMKIGDICRIIRPSETAGYGVSYRIVVEPVSHKKPK